jgi:MFS family permease
MADAAHDPYAALRSANYRLFGLGFLCSSTALQMLSLAVLWEVWNRTADPLAIGWTGVARAVPMVLLAIISGHAADVYSRKGIVLISQVGFATAAVLLALSSWYAAPMPVVYGLLVVTGVCRAFHGPARNSLFPQLVPADVFQNAVTWNVGVFQFAAVGGPVIAGWMIDRANAAWPVYVTTGVLCLRAAAATAFLQPREHERAAKGMTFAALAGGLVYMRKEKSVLGAITLDLLAVLFGGATALLPIYAEEILHVGPVGLGVLRAAPFAGALVMAIWLAHRRPFAKAGRALLWSVAVFGLATIVFGFSHWFWLSLVALLVAGAADNVSVVIRHVLVQMRTPEELRGRVSAVNSVFIECSNELGSFESGLVAKLFGPIASAVSGGVGTILVVLGVGAAFPELRRLQDLNTEQKKSE